MSNFRHPKDEKIKRWNGGNPQKNTTPGRVYGEDEKISDDTSSYGSDLEIIEEKETPKDKSLKVCRRNLFAFLTRRYRTSTLYLYRPCFFLFRSASRKLTRRLQILVIRVWLK